MKPALIGSGVIVLTIGLPCIAMGRYYRKVAGEERAKVEAESAKKQKKQKKGKGRKSQKNKRSKDKNKDQPGKEQGTSGGASLIFGGILFTIIGVVMIVFGLKGP
jgi:hypothetical protein